VKASARPLARAAGKLSRLPRHQQFTRALSAILADAARLFHLLAIPL